METKPIYAELAKRFQETIHAAIQGKKAEKKIRRLEELLHVIDTINQLAIQGDEKIAFLKQVCSLITKTLGGYHSWLALLDKTGVNLQAYIPPEIEDFLPLAEYLQRGNFPDCVRRALGQNRLVVVRNPISQCMDCPVASAYMGGAVLIRRLVFKTNVLGVLSVSVPGGLVDDVDAYMALNAMADHLALVLQNIENQEKLNRFKGILDTIPYPMSFLSQGYQYEAVNDYYTKLYNTSRARILGRTPGDFLGKEIFETRIKPCMDRCLAGEKVRGQACINFPGTGLRCMEMGFFPYIDEEGQITGIISQGFDITEQKRHEQVLASRLKLRESLAFHSEEELLRMSLDEAELLTDSCIGFFHFLESDQKTISLQMWSTNTLDRMCTAEGRGLHYSVDKAGIWVDCVRQRRPVIHNSYATVAHRKGMPEGHALIARMLTVPVFRDDLIVAILGVGNKETDYIQNDVKVVAEFAEMAWDIILRKRAENELMKSEIGLREAQRIAHMGSWEYDLRNNVLSWSDEVYRIFEVQPGDFGGTLEAFLEIVHPDDRQWLKKAYESAVNDRKLYSVDHRLLLKDGRIKYVHEECKTYYSDDGHAVRSIGTVQDITNQKQVEAKLKAAHVEFLTVLDSLDLTIYVADMETYEILFMNKHMKDLLGGDFTGQTCWKAFRRLTRPCSSCLKEQLVDENNQPTGVYVWEDTHPVTGHHNIYHDRAIKWVDGRLARLQIATDITRLKKMEARQLEYERRIQQAQKMEAIGTLAGGVAHDFNNILFSLMGYAELLKEDIPENNPSRAYVNEILNASYRSRDLVKQILTFSRQGEQEAKPMKLQPVLKEALKLLRASIPSTIAFRQNIDPACNLVCADPTQVHQIVMNLATNAYHAMEDTKGTLYISLRQVTLEPETSSFDNLIPGEYALLTVSDTGIGIPKDIVDRIFDPYFTTKSKEKGTGLGLSVVQGIVKSCNGDIRVYSEPGKGTEVHVYMPIIKQDGLPKLPDKNFRVSGGTESLLLVDDEEAIVRMEQRLLERLGYRVSTFTGSVEALNAFQANPGDFDLIITDMTMPNMTGIQLAGSIKNIRPDIPIILCTGFSYQIDEEKCREQGIEGFVMKPVIASTIANAVRKVLDGSAGSDDVVRRGK